jgi:hypothetical protein
VFHCAAHERQRVIRFLILINSYADCARRQLSTAHAPPDDKRQPKQAAVFFPDLSRASAKFSPSKSFYPNLATDNHHDIRNLSSKNKPWRRSAKQFYQLVINNFTPARAASNLAKLAALRLLRERFQQNLCDFII